MIQQSTSLQFGGDNHRVRRVYVRSEERLSPEMTIDSIAATWFQNRFAVAELRSSLHACGHQSTHIQIFAPISPPRI